MKRKVPVVRPTSAIYDDSLAVFTLVTGQELNNFVNLFCCVEDETEIWLTLKVALYERAILDQLGVTHTHTLAMVNQQCVLVLAEE